MSFRSLCTTSSIAVIALALAALQGCSPSAVTGSSPAKEPNSIPAGLGALGRDNPPPAAERQPVERSVLVSERFVDVPEAAQHGAAYASRLGCEQTCSRYIAEIVRKGDG